jgi:hypothetical protein
LQRFSIFRCHTHFRQPKVGIPLLHNPEGGRRRADVVAPNFGMVKHFLEQQGLAVAMAMVSNDSQKKQMVDDDYNGGSTCCFDLKTAMYPKHTEFLPFAFVSTGFSDKHLPN